MNWKFWKRWPYWRREYEILWKAYCKLEKGYIQLVDMNKKMLLILENGNKRTDEPVPKERS